MSLLDGYIPPLIVAGVAAVSISARSRFLRDRPGRHEVSSAITVGAALVALAATLELAMGRTPTYKYGPVRLWSGDIHSNQNSQQVADPYTFSHLIHGALFYGLTWLGLRSWPLPLRAIVAVAAEVAWEVFENTDMVINRYRADTISLDYYGDSVLNSVSDILACIVGFALAARLPAWATVVWVILVELAMAAWIRDNLTLNILMLLYPLKAVARWQQGG